MAGDVERVFEILTSDCEQEINNSLLNHSVPHSEERQMSLQNNKSSDGTK